MKPMVESSTTESHVEQDTQGCCHSDVSKDRESTAFLFQWLTSVIVKKSRTEHSPPDIFHQVRAERKGSLPLPTGNAPPSTIKVHLNGGKLIRCIASLPFFDASENMLRV